ncbi:PREDICTED: uncharacterized protein LOC104773991 [Camelina sativa]|uniref:Uncharacterized protein LOC104773991 n=1 Tax=Camelina sativa TaxID=90675 RepID=A0ABM0Y7Z7_CAMSA|nr:PREDICTED: uncharacterized protein LOC104773991 [Camelina sativa]
MTRQNQGRAGGHEPTETQQTLAMIQNLLTHMIQQQQQRNQGDPLADTSMGQFVRLVKMMKDIGVRKFKGETNTVQADRWLRTLEMHFETSECPMEYRKQIVVNLLEEDAGASWETVASRYRYVPISWETFKKEFELKYFPPESRDHLEELFISLEQREKSVRVYDQIFTKLRKYLYNGNDDEASMVRSVSKLEERAVNVETGIELEKSKMSREKKKEGMPPGKVVNSRRNNQEINKNQNSNRGKGGMIMSGRGLVRTGSGDSSPEQEENWAQPYGQEESWGQPFGSEEWGPYIYDEPSYGAARGYQAPSMSDMFDWENLGDTPRYSPLDSM